MAMSVLPSAAKTASDKSFRRHHSTIVPSVAPTRGGGGGGVNLGGSCNGLRSTSSLLVDDQEKRVHDEIRQLLLDIARIGPTHPSPEPKCLFGELFDDEFVEQFYEALVGTLKSAKKRGFITFKGQMLFKGMHDKVVISIVDSKINAAAQSSSGTTNEKGEVGGGGGGIHQKDDERPVAQKVSKEEGTLNKPVVAFKTNEEELCRHEKCRKVTSKSRKSFPLSSKENIPELLGTVLPQSNGVTTGASSATSVLSDTTSAVCVDGVTLNTDPIANKRPLPSHDNSSTTNSAPSKDSCIKQGEKQKEKEKEDNSGREQVDKCRVGLDASTKAVATQIKAANDDVKQTLQTYDRRRKSVPTFAMATTTKGRLWQRDTGKTRQEKEKKKSYTAIYTPSCNKISRASSLQSSHNDRTNSTTKPLTKPDKSLSQRCNMRVNDEIVQLVSDITRIGTPGERFCTFGELFDDDFVQQHYEALVGTLKSAKKRNVIQFKGQMLLKGVHDKVRIELGPDAI